MSAATKSVAKEVGMAILPKVIYGGLAIGAAYFLLVRPILVKVGVIQSAADKAEEKRQDQLTTQNSTSANSPFNINYWQTAGVVPSISIDQADALAIKLGDATDGWWDDEPEINAYLRSLKFKADVSLVAWRYFEKFNADLYTHFERNLNASELATVNNIVNNLA